MSTSAPPRVLVTGATGRLGRLVVDELLTSLPAGDITALVRGKRDGTGSRTAPFLAKGVEVREADYDDPASLAAAMAGIERVLLISSSELGVRVEQHRNVIEAARAGGVTLIAYTSVLHADRSTLSVADDHRRTEAMLAGSGVPFTLLRNGWYTENLLSSLPAALATGELPGAAGSGRIASAERADYAAAAAAVMAAREDQGGRVHELAGDTAYTLAELAAELSRQSGREVTYRDAPEAEFQAALVAAGVPDGLARLLASSHTAAADGALFDNGRDLSRLAGRATTPMAASIGMMLKGLKQEVPAGHGTANNASLGSVREITHP